MNEWVKEEYGGWGNFFLTIAIVVCMGCLLGCLISLAFLV